MKDAFYLESLYTHFHHLPAWLDRLIATRYLAADEVQYLEWLDDKNAEIESQTKRLVQEFSEEHLPDLIKHLIRLEQIYVDMRREGRTWVDRRLFLEWNNYEFTQKTISKIQARLYYTMTPGPLSESAIEHARTEPLEKWVKLTRQKVTKCLWHNDKKPSFYVANGFGYCFSCGAWADTIKYLMAERNMDFIEAVKLINRGD